MNLLNSNPITAQAGAVYNKTLGKWMKAGRAKEREAETRETAIMNTTKAVGNDELGRYQNPELMASQEKELADYSGAMEKTTNDFYERAGMKDSAQELASMKRWADDVKGIKFDMLEATKHESWAHAMQSLGLSMEASRQIAAMHTADRQEKIQLFTGLIGAIGKVVGAKGTA